MSIHPNYGAAILRGDKLVEFRKRPVANDVTHVILYATLPIGGIIGAFSVAGQAALSPVSLWNSFCDIGGIEHCDFESYYLSKVVGIGIQIGSVLGVEKPLCLDTALGLQRAPQSFQYIDTERAHALLSTMFPVDDAGPSEREWMLFH